MSGTIKMGTDRGEQDASACGVKMASEHCPGEHRIAPSSFPINAPALPDSLLQLFILRRAEDESTAFL